MTAPRRRDPRAGCDSQRHPVRVWKAVPAEGQDGFGSAGAYRRHRDGHGRHLPAPHDHRWVAFLLVDAPDGADARPRGHQRPLDIRDFPGRVRATTTNGPIGLANVAGEATAARRTGRSGSRDGRGRLTSTQERTDTGAAAGTRWDGGGLDRGAQNGPVGRGGSAWLPVSASGSRPKDTPRGPANTRRATRDSGRGTSTVARIDSGEGPRVVQITT